MIAKALPSYRLNQCRLMLTTYRKHCEDRGSVARRVNAGCYLQTKRKLATLAK